MKERKKKLRKQFLEERKKISDRDGKSILIQNKLLASPEYLNAKSILVYVNTGSEVETRRVIGQALADGKMVCVPYVEGEDIHPVEIEDFDDLAPGFKGILEPKVDVVAEKTVSLDEIDLIIAPGVLFNHLGFRLGMGGGYYDRLFSKSSAPRIGLAFEKQLHDEIPFEDHDQHVDKIITEKS